MTFDLSDRCTAFDGETCIAEGTLRDIAPIVRQALLRPDARPVFFFHDRSGRSIDLDLRGSEADMLAQLVAQHGVKLAVPVSTGPGRPKLGVTARSEEHTSELQSLMRISYAVFCLKQKKTK